MCKYCTCKSKSSPHIFPGCSVINRLYNFEQFKGLSTIHGQFTVTDTPSFYLHVFGLWEPTQAFRRTRKLHTLPLLGLELIYVNFLTIPVGLSMWLKKEEEKQPSEMIQRLRMRSFKHLYCSGFKHMLGRVFFLFFLSPATFGSSK